jgi:YHS domain-containing protein
MIKRNRLIASWVSSAALGVLVTSGCNPNNPLSDAGAKVPQSTIAQPRASGDAKTSEVSPLSAAMSESDNEHGHKAGAHGGIMVSLGRDSYHVEAVVESDGTIRLYTLGKDETRVIDVESQSLKGFVKADGDADSKSMDFEPSPQNGDAENKTSLFVGKLPAELVGRKLDVTIPSIRIAGERFRLGFQSGQASHDESPQMPVKLAHDAEMELYLSPGGRYTSADVAANGNVTASQKFKGIKSAHDMSPKPGDRICPITETKANPKFSWIIDGKSYQFCCPPCVDEFLKAAKSSTDPLPEPESFLKKQE